MGTMGEPKPSVAAIAHWSLVPMMLEPAYLMPACENMGYAYAPPAARLGRRPAAAAAGRAPRDPDGVTTGV